MFNLLKKKIYPIGVDLGDGHLRMAQLGFDGKGTFLHSGACRAKPEEITSGSAEWQRWAAETVGEMVLKNGFKGKNIITSLPSDDVFIDQTRMTRVPEDKLARAIFSEVSNKLPFPIESATLKHVILERTLNGDKIDILMLATEQKKVNRHLAIYEAAGLDIQSICVWPQTLINSYVNFFGRRQEDNDVVVMLMDICEDRCNIVVCKQFDLIFARVIPIGLKQLHNDGMIEKLTSEVDSCRRYCGATSTECRVQKLLFLAGAEIDKEIPAKVAELARRVHLPAQMGDVLSAISERPGRKNNIDKCQKDVAWAVAFGLSLAEATKAQLISI